MTQLAAIFESPAPAAAIPSGKGFTPAAGPATQGFARALKSASGEGETSPAGKDAGDGGKALVAAQQPAAARQASQVNAQQQPAGKTASQGGEAAKEAAGQGETAGHFDGETLAAEPGVAPVAGKDQAAAAEAAEGSKDAEPQGNKQQTAADTAAIKKGAAWNELKRKGLAAEAQQCGTAADPVLPREANAAKAAEKMEAGKTAGKSRGAERKEERSEADCHAADAAKSAANFNAAIFAVSGATLAKAAEVDSATATAGTAGGAVDAAGLIADPEQPADVQAGSAAPGKGTAAELAMVKPEERAGQGNQPKGAQVTQLPVHSAFERASFYAAGPAAPGAAVNQAQQGTKSSASAEEGKAGVLFRQGEAATAARAGQPQNIDPATPQETAKGATEGAQQRTAVPAQQGETRAKDSHAAEQQFQQVQVKAEQTENVAQRTAGNNEPRTVEGQHGLHAVEKGAAEPGDVAPKLGSEAPSGAATAPAGQTVKSASLQGNPGQNGSGNAGHNGHPGQSAQDSEQLQAAMMGMQTPTAAEAPQPETKGAGVKSALHESILAQVKDGVVTHNANGNSQISIRLNPEELGELKIHVRMEDNRLKVEVQADNRAVKDLLMSNLDSLKEALSSKNFTMEGFDVSSGGGGFNSPLNEQKGNPQQQAMPRFGRGGGYSEPVERQVKYVTADASSLLNVRF